MIIWFDDEFQSVGSPHTIEWLQCIVSKHNIMLRVLMISLLKKHYDILIMMETVKSIRKHI